MNLHFPMGFWGFIQNMGWLQQKNGGTQKFTRSFFCPRSCRPFLDFRVSDSYGKKRQKRFKDFGFHWALLCCVDYDGAKGWAWWHDALGYESLGEHAQPTELFNSFLFRLLLTLFPIFHHKNCSDSFEWLFVENAFLVGWWYISIWENLFPKSACRRVSSFRPGKTSRDAALPRGLPVLQFLRRSQRQSGLPLRCDAKNGWSSKRWIFREKRKIERSDLSFCGGGFKWFKYYPKQFTVGGSTHAVFSAPWLGCFTTASLVVFLLSPIWSGKTIQFDGSHSFQLGRKVQTPNQFPFQNLHFCGARYGPKEGFAPEKRLRTGS